MARALRVDQHRLFRAGDAVTVSASCPTRRTDRIDQIMPAARAA